MKYLFLLLVLTACTAPNTSAGTAATDTAAQTDLRPLPEEDYKLFINDGNPYLKEYQEFFDQQLKRYGTNTKGEPLVNFTELQTFASSNSFLGIARFMEEAFSTNTPAWTTNAGVVGETQDSCTVGFSAEFFPQTQILSERTLKRYIDYCGESNATYALEFAHFKDWHISNIVTLAEMAAYTRYTPPPYTNLYRGGLPLFKYFHEERKVPLPDDSLWSAFGSRREDFFNYFLEQGADIHWTDSAGRSILHSFFYDEQWPMAKTLIQKGLDPNFTTSWGATAFFDLLMLNRLSTAQKLLEYTDTNILPPGQTNLMEAALSAQKIYNPIEELSPEVVQFITDLSNGK